MGAQIVNFQRTGLVARLLRFLCASRAFRHSAEQNRFVPPLPVDCSMAAPQISHACVLGFGLRSVSAYRSDSTAATCCGDTGSSPERALTYLASST